MYLVLDIGGTFVKYAYMESDGKIHKQGKYPTSKADLDTFLKALDPYVKDVEGIAISCPGVIDAAKGEIINVTLLPYLSGLNLKAVLEERYHIQTSIENDAKCACLAEMWLGSLKNINSGLMMVLGSGIGGAIVLEGKLYKGLHYKAGELGSLLSKTPSGYLSFGGYCSGVKMIRDIASLLNLDTDDGEVVFEYIKQKHPQALEIFEHYCEEVAFQIYNIDYILDLDVIAIGGGISSQPLLIETISKKFMSLRTRYREDYHDPIIKACTFNNNANLIGALAHFKNQ